jgi:hypothetical protein
LRARGFESSRVKIRNPFLVGEVYTGQQRDRFHSPSREGVSVNGQSWTPSVAPHSGRLQVFRLNNADAVVDRRKEDIVAATREFAWNGLDAALITAFGCAADKALPVV